MSLFSRVLKSNAGFYSKNFSGGTNGILLYDMFYNQKQLIYGISKVALTVSKKLNLEPLGMLPLRVDAKTRQFAKSINPNTINLKVPLMVELFKNLVTITKLLFQIGTKKQLLDLKIDRVTIGPCIYDSLLRTFALPEINSFNFALKKRILLELLHFYFFRTVLKNKNIHFVVIGDNVYRYGLLFELCKENNIPCIAAIDLNAFTMAKYLTKEDYSFHPRQIMPNILEELNESMQIETAMDRYMSQRSKGNIEQHDVIAAYSNKMERSKEEFFKKYNLNDGLPVVVVMAHIFSDAPHGYPATLYNDYAEWFQETIKILIQNKSINLLVKEHPSVKLYGEDGLVMSMLKKQNAEHVMIFKDESTNSILQHANTVVTCGGTVGLEFSLMGKPVVLASYPPYSRLGFTLEFEKIEQYESFLKDQIQTVGPLNAQQKKLAYSAAWVAFELYNNYSDNLEIGSEPVMVGKTYNDNAFYNKIINTNTTLLTDQKVYHKMKDYLKSPHQAMINSYKLQQIMAGAHKDHETIN